MSFYPGISKYIVFQKIIFINLKKLVVEYFLMLVHSSQRKEFENWIGNSSIKEPERKNFFNWIVNSPVQIHILRIPPVRCSIKEDWCIGYYNGYVFDITVSIDHFDWMSYINKEYKYISIDSEVINYLNWIGDIPTSRFSIDQRTGYFDKKAHKKISVYLIKEDEKFYEIEAEKKFNLKVS